MKRVQVSVSSLMAAIVIIAVNMMLLRLLLPMQQSDPAQGYLEALPIANVLGISLLLAATALNARREVPLARVGFLVVGGGTVVLFLYAVHGAPYTYYGYLKATAGPCADFFLTPQQRNLIKLHIMAPALTQRGLGTLFRVVAVTVLLLVPALLVRLPLRRRRLRLVAGDGTPSGWEAVVVGLVTFAFAIAFAPFMLRDPLPLPRIGFTGSLPVASLLAVGAAVGAIKLVRHGEVSLSSFSFVMTGGTSLLLLMGLFDLVPEVFKLYLEVTAGLWVRPGKPVAEVFLLDANDMWSFRCFLAVVSIAPLVATPAILAARATRGQRLKIE